MEREHKKRMDLWKMGRTDIEIATICDVSNAAINSWRKKNGLENNRNNRKEGPGNHLNKDEEKTRRNLFEEGYTDSEIGAIVGVERMTIAFWRHNRGLFKSKRLISEKIDTLSPDEEILFDYLIDKYPHKAEASLLSVAKYAKPKISASPSPKQREFIKKIKIPGCKTVYYFDDGEYNCIEEAMTLFATTNSEFISENIGKIQSNMPANLYKMFVKCSDEI